jgi:hypothetical protein
LSEEDARKRLLDYLIAQATADLAAVSWMPVILCAGLLALARTAVMSLAVLCAVAALIGVFLLPVLVVMRRRRALLAPDVPRSTIDAHVALRRARQGSALQRHRALVARLEHGVTTPLMFLVLAAAVVRSLLTANAVALLLALSLTRGAWFLYGGPSRRALPQPPEIGG